jgi:hypothetical protein
MRGLKILVGVMGVMLIVGVAGLAVAVATRLSHRAPTPGTMFSAPPILLPHGSKIEMMSIGSDQSSCRSTLSMARWSLSSSTSPREESSARSRCGNNNKGRAGRVEI